ncbi:hypothetical protein RHSIM_Rhsim10G0032400 [Rhododendron simsii]|uniref:non-specific serine/threonine protein kinase n=1 Tax=Rhododendron simsii TaxID=118357 RepID=A0A834GDB5_RHOSS|nr:hypothetical protein RHSIM_Rhsim10G0032400 [Rhododendron simsii]
MGNNTISSSVYSVMLLAISMAGLYPVPSSAKLSSSSSISSSAEAKTLLNSGWWGNFSAVNPCYLDGIICNRAGSIIRMGIPYHYSYGVRGLADMNWSSLPNLEYLDLSHSYLSGGIPDEISTLSKLTHLDLSFNSFLQGVLPPSLGNLTRLVHLDLMETNIKGSIPSSIGNLSALAYLSLRSNQLSGCIPQEIGNLKNLRVIDMTSNGLNGSIPSSIGHLSYLTYLYLDSNQLSGPIPREIGKLKYLAKLNISLNNLDGPIPSSIGNLSSLTHLSLHSNQLSSSIPPEIGNLANLLEMNLSFNILNGPIPDIISELKNLKPSVHVKARIYGNLICPCLYAHVCYICSVLSRYGIHSVPSILVVNRMVKTRYHGSKNLSSFVQFFKRTTGLDPILDLTEDQGSYSESGLKFLYRWKGNSAKEILMMEP